MDGATDIGPLAREDLRSNLERQVQVAASVSAGARVLASGRIREGPGFFFEPTVLIDVTREMPVFQEETFGPVAVMLRASSDNDAVDIANDSPFGLGGNIWSSNIGKAVTLARRIETGGVFINGMTHSDPRLPFGGVKRSGYGRELSVFGIREFANIKTIWRP